MKKISHKERVEASKASIAKTKKLESKRMSPKLRKGINIGGVSIMTAGIVAGATVGIIAATKVSEYSNYPIDSKTVTSNDFFANKNPEQKFDVQTSGSQVTINAKQGPVKFISNYNGLFDKEKMGDFLSWFYNDVSWGPEIASLSSIKFLSGVQADNGQVTLGYHTTSREGSTVVMSPDVPFNWNKNTHIDQSIAYYVASNFGLDTNAKAAAIFSDIDPTSSKPVYVNLIDSDKFNKSILNVFLNSRSSSVETAYGQLKNFFNDKSLSDLKDVFNQATSNPAFNQVLMQILSSIFGEENVLGLDAGGNLVIDQRRTFFFLSQFTNPDDQTGTFDFDNSFLAKLFYQNQWSMSPTGLDDFDSLGDLSNIDISKSIARVYAEMVSGTNYHLATQGTMASYETKADKIKDLLGELLITTNVNEQETKAEKVKAVLNVPYLYFAKNGAMSKVSSGHQDGINYGTAVIQSMYYKLSNMSNDQINNIDQEWLFSQIFNTSSDTEYSYQKESDVLDSTGNKVLNADGKTPVTKTTIVKGKYTTDEVQNLISNFTDFSNEDMTQLSQHLDTKYHSGKYIYADKTLAPVNFDKDVQVNKKGEMIFNGKIVTRVPGLKVYKSRDERDDGLDDSFYDSITRRISQDMLYTISHEYGHHTTMWYAQDVSAMDNLQQIGENSDPTAGGAKVIPNTEVISKPSLDNYGDAGKYDIFRNAFSSKTFRNYMDKASDGDTRTDLTLQRFKTDFLVGNPDNPISSIEEVENKDGGLENFDNTVKGFSPKYLGPITSTSFGETQDGNTLASAILGRLVKEGDTPVADRDIITQSDSDVYDGVKALASALSVDISTDIKLQEFAKESVFKSLTLTGLFSDDINNYHILKPDGTPDADAIRNSGGAFSFMVLSNIVQDLEVTDPVSIAFNTLLANIVDSAKVGGTFADAFKKTSLKNLEVVIATMITFKEKFASQGMPDFVSPDMFLQWVNLYLVDGTQDTDTGTSLQTRIDNIVSNWKFDVQPEEVKYTQISYAKFESKIWDEARTQLPDATDGAFAVKNVTGQMLSQALYKKVGADSKSIFELLFSKTDDTEIQPLVVGVDTNGQQALGLGGNPFSIADDADTLSSKFQYYSLLADKITDGLGAKTIDDFKAKLATHIIVNVKGNYFAFELSKALQDKILDIFKDGGMLFTLPSGQYSPGAVAFMFTDDSDIEKYQTHFTTAKSATSPPSSFYRYSSTYTETLTRAWNQLCFNVESELLTEPGEYYDADPLRFASAGEAFYNLQSSDGKTHPDGKINLEGEKLREMYEKYYNTDKTISTMLRKRSSGLYSIMGYSDQDETIDGLVFTNPDADGQASKDSIVSEVDVIYNVDNYHIYNIHGDVESRERLTDRKSWMTDFSVLGDFKNSLLKQGEYDVWKWIDTNKDGEVTSDELHAILNSEIQNDGRMNNNGKSRQSAEIIGNPDDKGVSEEFRIKIGDVRI